MGVFNTIYGKIKCPYCKKEHSFDYPTKDFEIVVANYTLGDYIYCEDNSFYYPVEAYCDDHKSFCVYVIIKNGQIVKFVNENEINTINIDKVKNIEEGLGRKLEYLECCREGVGIANEKPNFQKHPMSIGNRFIALNTDWIVKEVFTEILIPTDNYKLNMLHKTWYKKSYIYKVQGNALGERLIRVTDRCIEVFYNNGFKESYDSENPHNFFLQYGCIINTIK